ncbi:molybdopterin-dependent oxidoreductase [Spongisporangium articulatum]|uniref:Molybdopterin-dependent oxidoreductase n=1 Tax=Spongisporangium articulatum TaxID=3362603 RepID=A0ABW8AMA8_9ACTN
MTEASVVQESPPSPGAQRRRTTTGALVGAAAGIGGLGAAQLVAGLVAQTSAPLIVLGDALIDFSPHWLVTFAKNTFGVHDKQVLLGGALVVALLLSAFAGVLAVRDSKLAPWVVLGLGALAALAAATRPDAGMLAVAPSLLGGLVGFFVLNWLARIAREWLDVAAYVRDEGDAVQAPYEQALRRRAFTGLGVVGVGGVLLGGLGQVLGGRLRGAQDSRSAVRLPAPSSPAPAVPAGADLKIDGLEPFVTSNADFYRIDTALVTPLLTAEDWSLRIHGLVRREITLTWDQLLAGRLVERDITLMCVSNPVGGDLTSNARWLGLPIKGLLEQAGPSAEADMVLSTSSDGFTAGTPLDVLTDGRDALLAIGMNGEPLPFEHGFPVRIVVPGLYGYVSATKWVVDLEVTRFDRAEGYWTPRGWSAKGPVKTGSRIDVPKDGATVKAGPVTVAGLAWQEHVGIAKVEVQVDDGAWQAAVLAAQDTADTWRQWRYDWTASPGRHRLRVRATNADLVTQTEAAAQPAPDGATGWHTIDVTVE